MLFVREILEEALVFGLLLGVGLAFVVVLGLARIHWYYRVSYGCVGRLQFAICDLFNRPPLFASTLHELEQRNDAIRCLLIVELAPHAYTLEHATPPNQLGVLVPEYLPSLPNDPYDAAPLRYLLKNDVPVVYSIGPDGDDDAGEGPTWSDLATEGDGDIVLGSLFGSAE